MSVNIVCFDGGGIRGLFTSIILKSLVRDLDGQFGFNLLSDVQLFSGTSTGSFIAMALANNPTEATIDTIKSLYMTGGDEIFHLQPFECDCILPSSVCNWMGAAEAEQGIEADLAAIWDIIKEIAQAKYPIEYQSGGKTLGLKPHLEAILGSSKSLDSLPATGPQVMVNSLQLYSPDQSQWAPVQIGSADGAFNSMRMVDAALCSGAAPIYFPPHAPVQTPSDNWGFFADGGLFANNPAAAAYAYATRYLAKGDTDIRVISIGTGSTLLGVPPSLISNASCWGGYKWLNPSSQSTKTVVNSETVVTPSGLLLEAALSASAQSCGQYASLLAGDQYVRINVDLPEAIPLDDWQAAVKMAPNIENKTSWTVGGNPNAPWQALVKKVYSVLTG